MLSSDPTKHRTEPHRTAPGPKILGDGMDQTPQRKVIQIHYPRGSTDQQLCPEPPVQPNAQLQVG